MKKFLSLFLIGIFSLSFISCNKEPANAPDLILINGKIETMDESIPRVEAIAIKADTIQNIGTTKSIKAMAGARTKIIDLAGKFVMPGFFESHAHFISVGESKLELDLSTASNWDDVIAQVAEAAENMQPGEWIVGRGWHQEKWGLCPEKNVEGYPYNDILSSATPYNPVLLKHASGHALIANKYAMKLANIDTSTENPKGGIIVRDTLKNAIGVFEEEAMNLIYSKYNKYLSERTPTEIKLHREKVVKLAVQECLKYGITSFEDAGSSFDEIEFFKDEIDSNKIPVRLNVMIYADNKSLEKNISNYRIINYGNYHLTVRAIKKYIDGALGSRGAWMLSDYSDLPNHVGLNVTPLSSLRKSANIAIENGFQMCTHAIGDKGNREILNIYEKAFKQHPDKTNLRWRVEHAQHLSRKDIPRFAKLGVIAAMQPIHATSDAPFVVKRLGRERAKRGAYVWRKLIDSGAIICSGTDAPIESLNTIANFYAAVTRRLKNGRVFFPEERMTRQEALKAYTYNGAYAAFQEKKLGSIEIGKLADLAVLSNDLINVEEWRIPRTKVVMTIIGGKIQFEEE